MLHKKMNRLSSDILHLALVLALARLGPELLWYRWQEPQEVTGAHLGSTLGYRQRNGHDTNLYDHRYTILKNPETYLLLNEVSRYRSFVPDDRVIYRDNVVAAYFSDNTPNDSFYSEEHNEEAISQNETLPSAQIESASGGFDPNEGQLPHPSESAENSFFVELSPEDIKLIEILWKQDIDIGVTREAFSFHDTESPEYNKFAEDDEFFKEAICVDHQLESPSAKCEEVDSVQTLASSNTNYVVDRETGEHIAQDDTFNGVAANSGLVDQSSLSFEQFENFTTDFFAREDSFGDNEFFSRDLFLPNDNVPEHLNVTQDFYLNDDDISDFNIDSDIFEGDLEKLEDVMALESIPDILESEMYPSMEEYWQDISTTLPLSAMNHPSAIPRSIRDYSNNPDDHSGASVTILEPPLEVVPQLTAANTPFSGASFHPIPLINRAPEVDSNFAYYSHALGPTSLGCAVASSIATLTNDTDPMPDGATGISNTFGLDLPNLLPANQTSHTTNENLLNDFLLDEDLQLMDVSVSTTGAHPNHPDAPTCRSLSLIFDPEPDSSDSVSSHNYHNAKDMKLVELTTSAYGRKALICENFQYPANQSPIHCGFRRMDTSSPNASYEMGISSSSSSSHRGNYSYNSHNHTYHLPLTNGNHVPKPLKRDKQKYEDLDDHDDLDDNDDDLINNKDEKRAKALDLPMTISEIINLTIEEFNEKITKFELSEPQHTLIRDIRRRGKNKVAAQNCRKRKMDQITCLQQDLQMLEDEKRQLEIENDQLCQIRTKVREKYARLYEVVNSQLQSSTGNSSFLSEFATPSDFSTPEPQSSLALPSTSRANLMQPENEKRYTKTIHTKKHASKKN